MNSEELFNNNQNLVYEVYRRKYGSYTPEKEELIQEGLLALWVASTSYKPEIAKFSTYAFMKIDCAMAKYIRNHSTCIHLSAREYEKNDHDTYKCARHYISLDAHIDDVDENETLHNFIGTAEDDYREVTKDLINRFVDTIDNERNRELVRDYYISQIDNTGVKQYEIAEKYGMSKANASLIIRTENARFQQFIS